MAKSDPSGQNNNARTDNTARFWLSLVVPGACALGIVALSVVVLWGNTNEDTTKYVFVAILPMLGTWVGTVLAYHFSKDNFESASRSVASMVDKMTSGEKLAATLVSEKMLKIDASGSVFLHKLGANEKLADLKLNADIVEPLEAKGYNRYPILDASDKPLLVIHKSTVDEYVSKRARDGDDKAALDALTLGRIFEEPSQIETLSFVVVEASDNLARAKSRMEGVTEYDCRDVMVTKDGSKGSAAVGWLTNVIIGEAAEV